LEHSVINISYEINNFVGKNVCRVELTTVVLLTWKWNLSNKRMLPQCNPGGYSFFHPGLWWASRILRNTSLWCLMANYDVTGTTVAKILQIYKRKYLQ